MQSKPQFNLGDIVCPAWNTGIVGEICGISNQSNQSDETYYNIWLASKKGFFAGKYVIDASPEQKLRYKLCQLNM